MPEITIPKTKDIDFGTLNDQIIQSLSSVSGMGLSDTEIIFRKDTDDFTTADRAIINGVLAAHDAASARSDRASRKILVDTQRGKDPSTLTDRQRIERIEIILGLD